ncbi:MULTISPECIES: SPW repeat protein [Halorussus]|uniref:SPW repeat domain-containing protein n=1 Tax=Halorussus TaxID=1070314 RepID=UPI000E2124C7|nr:MULTISPECIES: SPW repeat protein [Halorussus]NHN60169.1 hypothetical protein [Halorussus sp. JP-T4]
MSTDDDSAYDDEAYDTDDETYEQEAYDDEAYNDDNSSAKWSSAAVALLGLWLVVVPTFFWEAVGADFWNDLIVGAAIVALAAYSYYESSDEDLGGGTWASALNALLGLWMVVAPFVWGVDELLFWNDVAVGALVAVVAGYAAFASGEATAGLGTEQRT